MAKKMKLNLDELEVKSFITTIDDDKMNEIHGGAETITAIKVCTVNPGCKGYDTV